MSIPTNISKSHLLQAIDQIDREGIPSDGDSRYYDVLFKGKTYPPKLVVSLANKYANGEELERTSFRGGLGTPCFKLLQDNDFQIVNKNSSIMDIEPIITKFIDQAHAGELTTNDFPSQYGEFKLKVSFGIGNQARIPWIAIFDESRDSVSQGIYPVYLYYKEHGLLILAYGISETNPPHNDWGIENLQSINEFFNESEFPKPKRYGKSYTFKVYEAENISGYDLNEDLNEIIKNYVKTFQSSHTPIQKEFYPISSFNSSLQSSGLIYSKSLAMRFVSSLVTKPFVILTGLSGSGKTKLAQAFVQWISASKDQYCLVPVGADWTNREPLLGYPNALKENEYVKPDNGVLDLIIRAKDNQDLPYFLILDEMNLSHVERYFADFLSVMESNGEIPLHDGSGEQWNGVPSSVTLPKNLFIIGTVNIDETTNMFSPKVLDRANTIEFRVSKKDIADYLTNSRPLDMSKLEGAGSGMAGSFLQMAQRQDFDNTVITFLNNKLVLFFEELSKTGAEFGYRSAGEIKRLVHQLGVIDTDNELSNDQKLDIAVMQKLLPKLHGSRRKLVPVLKTLAALCLSEPQKDIEKDVFQKESFDLKDATVVLPLSLEKIIRMYKGAVDNGYASYAEA